MPSHYGHKKEKKRTDPLASRYVNNSDGKLNPYALTQGSVGGLAQEGVDGASRRGSAGGSKTTPPPFSRKGYRSHG